jgi:hypothetical protein
MESDSLQLRELVSADPYIQSPGWPWWLWAVIGLLAVGLILLIWSLFKRKNTENSPDLRLIADQAYRSALEKIEAAASLSPIQNVATDCSEAIRRYLATVTSDPSLYETHEEFLSRHQSLDGYPIEIRNGVSTGFSRLAKLKYGKSPNGDPNTITNEGRNLLMELHQHRPS